MASEILSGSQRVNIIKWQVKFYPVAKGLILLNGK